MTEPIETPEIDGQIIFTVADLAHALLKGMESGQLRGDWPIGLYATPYESGDLFIGSICVEEPLTPDQDPEDDERLYYEAGNPLDEPGAPKHLVILVGSGSLWPDNPQGIYATD